jgi:hypothetical protein
LAKEKTLKDKQQTGEPKSDRSEKRPIMVMINKDALNLVKFGSQEFKQLPAVEQARIFLFQRGKKVKGEYDPNT